MMIATEAQTEVAVETTPPEVVPERELSQREISNGRLLRLADFLAELPSQRFNFALWAKQTILRLEDGPECGSTGCALGWATAMPEFAELGLVLCNFNGVIEPLLIGHGLSGFGAAAEVFGVSYAEARFLFAPYRGERQFGSPGVHPGYGWTAPLFDATPRQVAAHIRRFVAERKP